jgi:hypothetical protein
VLNVSRVFACVHCGAHRAAGLSSAHHAVALACVRACVHSSVDVTRVCMHTRVCERVCLCGACVRARVLVRPCVRCLRGNCVCARVVYRQADVGAPGIQIIQGLNDLDKVRPNTQRCIGVILVSVCACGMPSCCAGAEPRACPCVRVSVA